MSKEKIKINKLLQFMINNNIEIVSHGLAPNPWGFCFECHNPKTPNHVKKYISDKLNALNITEVKELKAMVF